MKKSNLMKLLFIALSLVLVISLVACVSETPTEEPDESDSSVEESIPNTNETDPKEPADSSEEPSEETSEESSEPTACEHVEETVAGKAATCTEAGLTEGKKCSVCGETLVAQEPIPELGHTEEVVAGTAATCTTDGLTEGKKCSVCGETLVAQETIPAAHTEEVVTGTPATCTTAGLTDGKKCSVCGETLVAQKEIPALGHTKVDKAYTAPTAVEDGWLAHTACTVCGKAWNAENEEIPVPTISKLVPTVNVYRGFEDLSGWKIAGNPGNYATEPNADRSYVRYISTDNAGDGNANFIASNTAVTGQYLVIKYRTNHTTSMQVWANTLANGHDGGKANTYISMIADEQWHIRIIDLAAVLPTYVQAVDGTYTVQWGRIDLLDKGGDAGKYFDVGFLALTDDLTKIYSVMLEGDEALCPHAAAADAEWTLDPNDPAFEKADCIICDGKAERFVENTPDDLYMFTPDEIYNKTSGWASGTVKVTKDENGIPYIQFIASKDISSEQNGHLYSDTANPVTNIGKYVAILWRSTNSTALEVVVDSRSEGVKSNVCYIGGPAANNAWTFSVKPYTAFENATAGGYFDGEKFTAFRLDWFNGTVATGATRDIAFIAYFDTEAEAYAYYAQYVKAYNMPHDHEFKYAWDTTVKLYTGECAVCGEAAPEKDMLYKTEGITNASHVGSGSNFLTAESITEGGETFTRYTAVGTATDPYFYPIRYNTTNVTGKYMIIKYRVVNNGTNLSTGATYASSAASGQTTAAGKNGDGSMYVAPNTWYADGEWHTIMIQPTDNNLTFTANADGTYTWAYVRIRVNNLAVGGYIDIAEIAFADNAEAADLYACKNDANLVFVANIDAENAQIDGVPFLSAAAQKASTVVFDMSQYAALTTPTSLSLGGWVCTRGGVSNYQIRVTKIDGVAVENPELKSFFGGTDRSDIFDGYGKDHGYTSECANGAGMNLSTVDLTAWAGHTVEFEIVVTNNAGQQFVAVRCQNVVVPEVVSEPEVPTYVHLNNVGGNKNLGSHGAAVVDSTALTTSTSADYLGRIYITGRVAIAGTAQKLVYRLLDANGNQIQGWQELDYYSTNTFTFTDVTEGTAHLGTAQKVVPEVTNAYEYVGLANITAFPGQTVTVECALVLDGVEGEAAYYTFATFKNVTNTQSAS